MDVEGPIIGIDLGTTNSVVAMMDAGKPRVIPNSEGANKTPSVAGFLDGGRVVVGELARRQAATNPLRTIFSVKRLMGRYFSEVAEDGENKRLPLRTDDSDRVLLEIDGVGYTPQQISALVLSKLKTAAEEFTGTKITKAIITVPAYFDDLQRTATQEAGRFAGLEVLRLINEPTAAAMAYGLGQEREELVAVYDFGGGTFDISILEIDNNTFEVVNCAGDTHLGGDDLDQLLAKELCSRFERQNGFALELDAAGHRRLLDAAEKAKCELSTLRQTQVSLPFLAMRQNQPLHLDLLIQRNEFEALIEDRVQRTLEICEKALREAHKNVSEIRKVILVGGTTRMPLVQEMVEDFFGLQPFKGVNPDEIVALGAATQAGVLSGALQEVVLMDVTPHSLGLEVKDGRHSVIIEKNSTIPLKSAKTFTTTEDNQTFVNIHVLQGESEQASENRSLGKFTLSEIPAAPVGQPRIRVTFFINSDGVVEIAATEMTSGVQKSLTIAHSFLSVEERERRHRDRQRKGRRRRKATPDEELPLSGVRLEPGPAGASAMPAADETPAPTAKHDFDEVVNETTGDEDASRPGVSTVVRLGGGAAKLPLSSASEANEDTDAGVAPKPAAKVDDTVRMDKNETPMPTPAPIIIEVSAPPPAVENAPPASRRQMSDNAGETQAVFPAPAPQPVAVEWDTLMTEARIALERRLAGASASGSEGEESKAVLQKSIPAFQSYVNAHSGDWDARLCLSRIYLACLMPEECRTALSVLAKAEGRYRDTAFGAYQLLVARFPNYIQARREKMELALQLGRVNEAIEDIEALQEQDQTQHETVKRMVETYRPRLEATPDSTAQFKLVKIYLRLQKLDEGIELLRRLIKNPEYRDKALRVLGLCYWQKNMHELAWQTLRELTIDRDLKDILYRLANDMEALDQLTSAREIFAHILADGEECRDAPVRLRKVEFRLRLRQEQMQQTSSSNDERLELNDMRFALIEEINRGSMGIVYKARDKILDEIVALKILTDLLATDPLSVERFKQEARAAKRLSHPNIVRIHDFFESGNKKFLSMEFIDGLDLKKLMAQKGRLPEEELRELMIDTLRALDYAHRLGVVHRDIKPANIMVTKNKEVKVTDFGIAKILSSEDITRTNAMIVGTPLYMSPEQIEGSNVDARSDIYSLGITCYELLTGMPPFHEGNIEYHHIHTPAPALPATTSAMLRQFVMKSVEKNPNDRFQTSRQALEFLNARD